MSRTMSVSANHVRRKSLAVQKAVGEISRGDVHFEVDGNYLVLSGHSNDNGGGHGLHIAVPVITSMAAASMRGAHRKSIRNKQGVKAEARAIYMG